MDPSGTQVKRQRGYDATRRRARAERKRAAILEAALARFLAQGYATTTVESIAKDAGVSAATIYKQHGGKSGLVRSLSAVALAGVGPVPAERRSDELQATEDDPHKLLQAWGRLVAEVAPRIAPILLLLRDAAATDREAAALATQLDNDRLDRMSRNAHALIQSGGLRPGLTHADVRDVLWLYSAPELYDLMIRRRLWSLERYGRFVADAMACALLP